MRRVVLTSRPMGDPQASDFTVEEGATPDAGSGQLLLEVLFLSIDPYMRLSLDAGGAENIPPLPLGQAPVGRAVARVLASHADGFAPGDVVEGRMPWADIVAIDAGAVVRKLDFTGLPLSYAVGALGMPGQTSYAGMVQVGRVREGDTAVISAAAGAVGSLAGQIAKIKGARVIGIAGGAAKCAAVTALGFDACVDYKSPEFTDRLADALPDGFQIYFENVGGDMTLQVLEHATYGARVPLCGLLALYGARDTRRTDRMPDLMERIFLKGLEMRGFHGEGLGGAEALVANRDWIEEGRLRPAEVIVDGIEQVAGTFAGIFRGNSHVGKVVVRLGG